MSLLAAAASATIQLIGIVMVSQQGPTLQAIIPKIPPPPVHGAAPVNIEPHMAFISFPKSKVLYNGWGTPLTDLTNGYAYVLLDHDEIVFDTLGVKNERIRTDRNKPLPVPTLTFSGPHSLIQPYQTASNLGTAGVVDIPEGSLTPCHAQVIGMPGVLTRTDTQVKLNTNGVIVIRTIDGSKILTLLANDNIYINNVPKPWALHHETDPNYALHHWQMYYLMTTQPNGTQAPQDPPANVLQATIHQNRIPDCAESPALPPPPPGGGGPNTTLSQVRMGAMQMTSATTSSTNSGPDPIVCVNTAECSDTQWP